MATKKIEYHAMEDTLFDVPEGCPRQWRVEALDVDRDGGVYITLFDGLDAQKRAIEYALFKNGKLTAAKPAGASTAGPDKPPTQITVTIQDGSEKTLYLSGLVWKYDAKRKHITARARSPIEPTKGISALSLGAD